MREYLHGPSYCLSLFLRERLLSMPFAWSLLVAFTCKGTHFFGTRLVCSSVLSSNGAEIIVWACRQVSFFLRVPSRSGCLVSGLEAIHGQLFSCASYYQLTSFSCLGNVKTSKQRCQNKNVKRYNVKTLIGWLGQVKEPGKWTGVPVLDGWISSVFSTRYRRMRFRKRQSKEAKTKTL